MVGFGLNPSLLEMREHRLLDQRRRKHRRLGLFSLHVDLLAHMSRFLAQSCAQLTLLDRWGIPMIFSACTFSPCNRMLCGIGLTDKKIQQWDLRTGKHLVSFDGHTGSRANKVCLSLSLFVRIRSSSSAVLLHKALHALLPPSDCIKCCYHPHGNTIVSCADDKTLKVSVLRMREKRERMNVQLLSVSQCICLKLWCAESGLLKGTFEGHLKSVRSCCFSPCGERILSASRDR